MRNISRRKVNTSRRRRQYVIKGKKSFNESLSQIAKRSKMKLQQKLLSHKVVKGYDISLCDPTQNANVKTPKITVYIPSFIIAETGFCYS